MMTARDWLCLACKAVLGHRHGRELQVVGEAITEVVDQERGLKVVCKCGEHRYWTHRAC